MASQILEQVVRIDEHVVVDFVDEFGASAVPARPPQPHHGLEGEILVGVDEVFHDDVAELAGFSADELVEDRIRRGPEEKDGADLARVVAREFGPRVANRRARIPRLMSRRDQHQ